jgi:hypothetical protein
VPTLAPSIYLTRRELGYLAWHEDIRPTHEGVTGTDLIYKAVGIIGEESAGRNGGITGMYRPQRENTYPDAGPDLGMCMWNTNLSRVKYLFDPYVVFHPLDALREMHAQMFAEHWSPFARWSYPGKKTDASIDLASVKADLGPPDQIYNIDRSPYWKMLWAGMDVRDLPQPPADVYVSRLPPAPLRYGNSFGGTTGNPTAVNSLQKWLAENRLFAGTFDNYYGPRVSAGVAQVQLLLQRLGLWTGLVDGKQWSVELKALVDDMLEWDFLTAWG